MFYIYGSRLYGRVDQAPGRFHVATLFVHIWFIPLIPIRSYLIVEGWQSDQGIRIPMSFKSVLAAYLRAALILTPLVLLFKTWLLLQDAPQGQGMGVFPWVRPIAIGLLCLIGYWSTYRLLRASDQKVKAFARHI